MADYWWGTYQPPSTSGNQSRRKKKKKKKPKVEVSLASMIKAAEKTMDGKEVRKNPPPRITISLTKKSYNEEEIRGMGLVALPSELGSGLYGTVLKNGFKQYSNVCRKVSPDLYVPLKRPT